MEKRQAHEYISDVLKSRFNQEQFELFMRNLLNEFEPRSNNYSGNLIPEAFRDHIAHYKRIGKYTDPEGEPLDILIVQTRSVRKLERTRTALRNFVVRHLKTFDKQYALVAFYSKEDDGVDWRLSLVKIDYESQCNEEGKIKIKEDLVPARRFSYLVGENEDAYTAQKQLLPLLTNDHTNPLVVAEKDGDGSIEGAFSVEKVTNEFFEQYKELYLKLSENVSLVQALEKEGLDPVRFVKKLLGQIVFLYFLQKKGWLGVPKDDKKGKGSKRFLQDRFELIDENSKNYFNDFLRYLFYAALARKHNDEGIQYYFRQLDCKIPFLNGGLFEAEYDWETANIELPNNFFRNNEKNNAGDKGTGILDVFDRYNFTIKEDEPLEKEVAVDPEMLGKVFENMLEITERKSKGAYYTPREIVHYMCQESLIHYLDNCLNFDSGDEMINLISKEDIEKFIRHGHLVLENDEDYFKTEQRIVKGEIKSTKKKALLPESINTHAETIDQALADIKICDPAIGSGAFPVGMLNEIVTARLVLIPFLIQSPSINQTNHSYRLKRHAIQESIYGVDIDASAIDIARLRLWLSMIVDEEDYNTIEALPNLDYKIVCGNSLIGMPENAMRDLEVEAELEDLKEEFFVETGEQEKQRLREQINKKIRQLLDSAKQWAGYSIEFDYKVFFSEVWHKKKNESDKRKARDGFDIVIGNPPYVSISKTPEKETLKIIGYDTFATTGDLYTLFYEKGNRILKQKGNLCLITSNKWLNTSYGSKTRKYFSKKTNPLILIDFAKVRIFPSATVFVNILLFERAVPQNKLKAIAVIGTRIPAEPLENFFEANSIELTNIGEDIWKISTGKGILINDRIEELGIPLKDWQGIEFFRGITTGYNGAYHIKKDGRTKLIESDPKSSKFIYPLLRGKDIKRWRYQFEDWYMLFIPWHFPLHEVPSISKPSSKAENEFKSKYPALYNHLLDHKEKLSARNKDETGVRYEWYALQRYGSNYWKEFLKPKIVWIEISDRANYAFDDIGHFLTNSAYFISGDNLKYLVGVLNSSVSDYYFFQVTAKIAGGRKRYTKQYVEQIPIPQISKQGQEPYELVVDYVINSKKLTTDLVFSFFEQLLDAIVFELYFEKELQSANKQILPHLGNLKPITDEMSDEEKLAIIQSEFERLYDPNHQVSNNLETLDSIEEVRIIKEALK